MAESTENITKRGFIKEFSWLGSSTILFQASRVGTELTVAKLLGPDVWGVWYFLNLLLAYRSFFHFGVINGLNREVPVLTGKGDIEQAQRLENSALSFLLTGTLIFGTVTGFGYYLMDADRFQTFLVPMVLLLLVSQLFDYLSVLCTTRLYFEKLAKLKILYALAAPALIIPGVAAVGLSGLIYGMIIAYTLVAIGFYFRIQFAWPSFFQVRDIKRLISIGFPIMLVGVAFTVLLTVDRILIGVFMSIRDVGIYSLTIIVFGLIVLLPRIINQQYYPRMARAYGKGGSFESIVGMMHEQRKYVLLLVTSVVIAVIVIFPIGIPILLPEYEEGVYALMIVSVSGLSVYLSSGWGTYLHLINKQSLSLRLILVAIVINVMITSSLLQLGYGLIGVALGTTVSFVAFNAAIMYFGKQFSVRDNDVSIN